MCQNFLSEDLDKIENLSIYIKDFPPFKDLFSILRLFQSVKKLILVDLQLQGPPKTIKGLMETPKERADLKILGAGKLSR
jgi:hypothetical protein